MLVTLENHANNVLERPDDYEEIFAAIDSPNIGMCLDTGHFEGVDVDLHQVIDRFHSRILHVDLKDCKARGKGHDTVPFGQGVTDFDGFLKHLSEKNYKGYLVVEQAWREPKGGLGERLERIVPTISAVGTELIAGRQPIEIVDSWFNRLRQEVFEHIPVNIGQSESAPVVQIGQAFVFDPQ